MLNRFRIGEKVTVYRDIIPLELPKDTSAIVKSFYFDNKHNCNYIVEWRGHEVVCTEDELIKPNKKYKYSNGYMCNFKKATTF